MTHFAEAFAWCMLQVTVFSLVAACLYGVVVRFRLGSASTVLISSLAMVGLLTLACAAPWPRWFIRPEAATADHISIVSRDRSPIAAATEQGSQSIPLLARRAPTPDHSPKSNSGRPRRRKPAYVRSWHLAKSFNSTKCQLQCRPTDGMADNSGIHSSDRRGGWRAAIDNRNHHVAEIPKIQSADQRSGDSTTRGGVCCWVSLDSQSRSARVRFAAYRCDGRLPEAADSAAGGVACLDARRTAGRVGARTGAHPPAAFSDMGAEPIAARCPLLSPAGALAYAATAAGARVGGRRAGGASVRSPQPIRHSARRTRTRQRAAARFVRHLRSVHVPTFSDEENRHVTSNRGAKSFFAQIADGRAANVGSRRRVGRRPAIIACGGT